VVASAVVMTFLLVEGFDAVRPSRHG
jgi:hypothetical protein